MKTPIVGELTLRPANEDNSQRRNETSISQSTFQPLPFDVQMDHTKFYQLENASSLTTKESCAALFMGAQWTPALDIAGHVRLVTADGAVVAKEVIDLVEWVLERDAQLTNQVFPGDLKTLQNHLQISHMQLKASVEESQQAVRESSVHFFLLQNQLEEEKNYQSSVFATITSTVGAEVMEGTYPRFGDNVGYYGVDWNTRQASRSTQGASTSAADGAPFASQPARPYHVFSISPSDISPSTLLSSAFLKRNREDENEPDLESSRVHKRPRIGNHKPWTILNCPSEDQHTDGTYSDSGGTERDFEDDPYSFLDSRGETPYSELVVSSDGELSQSATDNSRNGTQWNNLPDYDDDSGDSNYQLPDWDMEDIWEIGAAVDANWHMVEYPLWHFEHAKQHLRGAHPLFKFKALNELRECKGVISDAGLSTDDPDEGYHEVGMLCQPTPSVTLDLTRCSGNEWTRELSQSLGPLLTWPKWHNSLMYTMMDGVFARQRSTEEKIYRYRNRKWCDVKHMAVYHGFYPVDFQQRLAELISSDHSQFYFDDDGWKDFAPDQVSSRHPDEVLVPQASSSQQLTDWDPVPS